MANKRDVELALRATDLATKTFNDVAAATDTLTAALAKQTESAKTGNTSVRELQGTLDKLRQVQGDLARDNALVERYKQAATALQAMEQRATLAAEKLTALRTAQAGASNVTAAQARELSRAEVASTKAAEGLAKAQGRAREYAAQLDAIGLSTNDLAAADAKLISQFERLGAAIASNKAAITDYDANRRAHKDAQAAEAAQAQALRQKEQAQDSAYTAFLAEQETARAAKSRQIGDALVADKAARDQAYTATYATLLDERERMTVAAAERERAAQAAETEKSASFDKEIAALRAFAAKQEEVRRQFYVADWKRLLDERDKLTAESLAKEVAMSDEIARQEKARMKELDAVVEKYLDKQRKGGGGGGGTPSSQQRVFLGLKPYELQDIAYRVNDVFVQLAAGQTLTETLAVQGFKAFKIFDGEIGNLLGMLPALAAGGAVLATVAVALVRVEENASALRNYSKELEVSADGARYNAQALVEQQRALEQVGIGFKDAGAAFATFMKIGVGQGDLAKLTQQAYDLSRVFGITVPEAAKKMADGFGGGIRGIIDLNNEYNFLSVSQYKAIQQLYDAGKAAQAQAMAQDILAEKTHRAAEEFEGPWSKAFRDAKIAASGFFDLLSNGQLGQWLGELVQRIANDLDRWVNDIKWLTDHVPKMGGGDDGSLDGLTKQRDDARAYRDYLEQQRAQRAQPGAAFGGKVARADLDEQIGQADAAYERLSAAVDKAREAQDKHTASVKKTGEAIDTTSAREIAGAKALHDLQLQYMRERRTDRAGQIQAAGEEEYQSILDQTHDPASAQKGRQMAEAQERYKLAEEDRQKAVRLIDELETAGKQALTGTKDNLDAQLKAVDETYDKIYIKLEQFQHRGGGSILGMSPEAFRSALDQSKEIAKQQATMQFYDKELQAVQQDRAAQEKSIMEQLHNGTITAADAYAKLLQSANKLRPQIQGLTKDALAFAKTQKQTPMVEQFSDRMTRGQAGNTGVDASPIEKEELKQINDMLKERNDIAKQFQDLAAAGAITEQSAQKQIVAVYADMKTKILDATDALSKFMKAAGSTGPAYQMELLRAEIAKVRGEAQEADPATTKLKESITNIVSSNVMSGLEKMADLLGQFAQKGSKLKDIFQQIGVVAMQMIANIVKGIAEEIIKEQILIEVKTIENSLFHEGGIVGDSSAGLMTRSVSPAVFAGAPRYHTGAVVGLAPDEQAAILQKGEEVLTRGDPRNALNGGRSRGAASGGTAQSIRQVLVMREEDIAGAMAGAHGEQTVLTHLKQNLPTVRQWLNGKN